MVMERKSVLVLGVGNVLLSDEGVGVHVARRLQSMDLPRWVEVVDGGTGGFELIEFCRGKEKVVIVDAIRADAEPGALFRLRLADVDLPKHGRFSAHHEGLDELLRLCPSLLPDTNLVLYGIVPDDMRPGMTLSPALEQQLDLFIARILEEAATSAL